MEGLTRLVTESLARHGFDRPLDYRRLHWSRWFRCDSPHSLLFVPSKPGVFAVAEEIMDLNAHVATAAKPALSEVEGAVPRSQASGEVPEAGGRDPDARSPRRMLAVTQFFEDDDMAFVLDRMLSRRNPMADRLASGRYFVRFVVVEDRTQRHGICNALNEWMVSSAEKATGIGSHFATSLELTPATEYVPQPDDRQQSLFAASSDTHVAADAFVSPATLSEAKGSAPVWDRVSDPVRPGEARRDLADTADTHVATGDSPVPRSRSGAAPSIPAFASPSHTPTTPQLDSGAATNIHCPTPIPSGF